MSLNDTFLDLINHTSMFVSDLKIIGDENKTEFSAIDDDQKINVKGHMHEPISQFKGEFGLCNLSILKGFAGLPNFKSDEASVEVKREEHNNEEQPSEIVFTDAQGQTATYRLKNKKLLPKQPTLSLKKWDITLTPERKKVQEFQQFANILSSQENYFLPKTKKQDDGSIQLRFHIGQEDDANHKGFIIFDNNVDGELTGNWYWPTSYILSILKLHNAEDFEIKFAEKGALQLSVDSDYAHYEYILPGWKK